MVAALFGDANVFQSAVPHKNMWGVLPPSRADNVLPSHRAAMPTLEEMRASPHYPIVVTPDPSIDGPVLNNNVDPGQQLPINGEAFDVESDMFKGKLMIHMANLPTTDPSVFEGKKRTIHVAVQGKFKRRVRAGALCTGQEFHIPIHGGPSVEWMVEQLLRACAKVFSKTTMVDAHSDQPYFLNPIMAACQLVNVAKDGAQPNIWEAQEDCRLLSPRLSDALGRPLPAERRRKWCDDPAHMQGLWFNTEHVYTFHVWQHLLDFGTYKAHVGGFVSFDLTWILCSQPIGIMVKDLDSGDYAYSMLAWHERLLYPEEHGRVQRAKKDKERAKTIGRIKEGVRGLKFWA